MKTKSFILAYIWIDMISNATTLKCWKCISHDCEDYHKASEVACNDGNKCMKVRYMMFDNVTHYDSIVRTCTAGPCLATTQEEFQKCLSTPKLYMISGCSLRTCCADRDMCNTGALVTATLAFVGIIWLTATFLICFSTTTACFAES